MSPNAIDRRTSDTALRTQRIQFDSKRKSTLLRGFHENSSEAFFQTEPKIKLSYKRNQPTLLELQLSFYCYFQMSETRESILLTFQTSAK